MQYKVVSLLGKLYPFEYNSHPLLRFASPYKEPPRLSFGARNQEHFREELWRGGAYSEMKNPTQGQVVGIPVASVSYGSNSKQNIKDSILRWMRKLSKKADNYVQGIRDHVNLGPKISETVKGKSSLSAKIIQAGGVERVFKQVFSVEKGEKLLKATKCYLSTTAGPIAGMVFISTEKVAFHSDRSLRLTSPKGEVARVPYKVLIPLRRIKRVVSSESADKPSKKYIHLVTVDGYEFWFMGFVSYQKSFKYLQQTISECQ